MLVIGRDVAKYKINIFLPAGEFPRAEGGKARGRAESQAEFWLLWKRFLGSDGRYP